MKTDIKSRVVVNFLWKFAERIGAQVVTFVVSIVLAWFVVPEQYSSISLVTIMIMLCNLLVTSGFGNSLVQKENADNLDFSSVFYFSIGSSVLVYLILFFTAPYISSFYEFPSLTAIIRVMSIRIIISAINSVQQAYVARRMEFKRFFFSTLGGTIVSGIVGIIMAIKGFGVWAIVAQYLTNSAIDTLVLWFTVKWRPEAKFSFERLKGLLSFGWKVLAGAMIDEIYNNMRFFVVGRIDGEQLSLYNNGNRIPNLIVDNVNSSLYVVMFPAFAQNQNDIGKVKQMMRRSIRVCTFIMMPLMVGLAMCSAGIVDVILPDTWQFTTRYIQLCSLAFVVVPLQTANMQAIRAIGRSDVSLVTEVVKKIIGFALLFGIMFGNFEDKPYLIALSGVFTAFLFALINAFPNKIYIGYKFREQLFDIIPPAVLSATMALAIFGVQKCLSGGILSLFVQVATGVIVYIALAWIFKVDSFTFLLDFVKGAINGKKSAEENQTEENKKAENKTEESQTEESPAEESED